MSGVVYLLSGTLSVGNTVGTSVGVVKILSDLGNGVYGTSIGVTSIQEDVPASSPVNTLAPVVTGVTYNGQTMNTTDGTWTGSPTPSFTYQWQSSTDGGSNFSNISGETSSSLVIDSTTEGTSIRCVVTATNSEGSASANSNAIENWIPTDETNLQAWWDLSDLSTITSLSNLISQLDDKSGNNKNLTQSVGANQPVFNATGLNNLPTLECNGSTQSLDLVDGSPTFGTSDLSAVDPGDLFTVFAVGIGRTGSSYQSNVGRVAVFVGKAGGIGQAGTFVLGIGTSDGNDDVITPPRLIVLYNGYVNTGNLGILNINNFTSSSLNTPVIAGSLWNGTQEEGTHNGFPYDSTGAIGTKENQNSPFKIGGTGGGFNTPGASMGNSSVSEVVIYDTNLSTTNRQKLEGYMAFKWNLTSNLPVSHPYKNTAPLP